MDAFTPSLIQTVQLKIDDTFRVGSSQNFSALRQAPFGSLLTALRTLLLTLRQLLTDLHQAAH